MPAERSYFLGTHDEELERLGIQHGAWRPTVLECWRRAGIGPGSRVIDVGAGPGFASADLAEIVGPSGRVVAVERSARFVEAADALGVRVYTGPSYRNVIMYSADDGRLDYDWDDERGPRGLRAGLAFAEQYDGAAGGRVRAILCPGHPDTCAESLLQKTARQARQHDLALMHGGRVIRDAAALRITAGHQRRARRRTHRRIRVPTREPRARFCEGVDVRRLDVRCSLATEVMVAVIVREDHDQIWPHSQSAQKGRRV